ncbi:MAG: hypothetical protein HFH82_05230 [Lachnospiraceae bacterium]|nr:hypothetical protein [Lachnospiraceae bacterium]
MDITRTVGAYSHVYKGVSALSNKETAKNRAAENELTRSKVTKNVTAENEIIDISVTKNQTTNAQNGTETIKNSNYSEKEKPDKEYANAEEYYEYLKRRYPCLTAPDYKVTISPIYLEKCVNDPKQAKALEKVLEHLPVSHQLLVARWNMLGASVKNEEWVFYEDGTGGLSPRMYVTSRNVSSGRTGQDKIKKKKTKKKTTAKEYYKKKKRLRKRLAKKQAIKKQILEEFKEKQAAKERMREKYREKRTKEGLEEKEYAEELLKEEWEDKEIDEILRKKSALSSAQNAGWVIEQYEANVIIM